MKTIAIILAGGEGRRFSNKQFKQFLPIAGKPLLYHTIEKFHSIEEIDEIVVVSHKDFVDGVKRVACDGDFEKVRMVIEGGESRTASTYKALTVLSEQECEKVLIHDAVRPLVSQSLIKECIASLEVHPACAVAIPATDTVFEVCEHKIVCVPDRKRMYLAQTPQGFHLALMQEAYKRMTNDAHSPVFSDDCGIFMHYLTGQHICVVDGIRENIKLTYPEDEAYIKRIIESNKQKE